MENKVKVNDITVIKVVTKASLQALHLVLGVGVGVGLSKPRPNKTKPSVQCCINDQIFSVDLPDRLHPAYVTDPTQRVIGGNFIELFYTMQNHSLQINIRGTKMIITNEGVALSRIPTADIQVPPNPVSAYVGAMFFFGDNNDLLTVCQIQGATVTCCYADDDRSHLPPMNLPLEEVTPLITRFGRRRRAR
jgi:hypothetical protein